MLSALGKRRWREGQLSSQTFAYVALMTFPASYHYHSQYRRAKGREGKKGGRVKVTDLGFFALAPENKYSSRFLYTYSIVLIIPYIIY